MLAQAHCPVDLHHPRQHRGLWEVATEVRQIRRDDQLKTQLIVDLLLAEQLRLFWARRKEHCIDLSLRQLALGVERQVAQDPPASRQGDGFAMRSQVIAQLFGQRAPAPIAQGMEAVGA